MKFKQLFNLGFLFGIILNTFFLFGAVAEVAPAELPPRDLLILLDNGIEATEKKSLAKITLISAIMAGKPAIVSGSVLYRMISQGAAFQKKELQVPGALKAHLDNNLRNNFKDIESYFYAHLFDSCSVFKSTKADLYVVIPFKGERSALEARTGIKVGHENLVNQINGLQPLDELLKASWGGLNATEAFVIKNLNKNLPHIDTFLELLTQGKELQNGRWNIALHGHGVIDIVPSFVPRTIAGIAKSDLVKFMKFLHQSITTESLSIQTCFCGGNNQYVIGAIMQMLEQQNPQCSFPVILATSVDAITYAGGMDFGPVQNQLASHDPSYFLSETDVVGKYFELLHAANDLHRAGQADRAAIVAAYKGVIDIIYANNIAGLYGHKGEDTLQASAVPALRFPGGSFRAMDDSLVYLNSRAELSGGLNSESEPYRRAFRVEGKRGIFLDAARIEYPIVIKSDFPLAGASLLTHKHTFKVTDRGLEYVSKCQDVQPDPAVGAGGAGASVQVPRMSFGDRARVFWQVLQQIPSQVRRFVNERMGYGQGEENFDHTTVSQNIPIIFSNLQGNVSHYLQQITVENPEISFDRFIKQAFFNTKTFPYEQIITIGRLICGGKVYRDVKIVRQTHFSYMSVLFGSDEHFYNQGTVEYTDMQGNRMKGDLKDTAALKSTSPFVLRPMTLTFKQYKQAVADRCESLVVVSGTENVKQKVMEFVDQEPSLLQVVADRVRPTMMHIFSGLLWRGSNESTRDIEVKRLVKSEFYLDLIWLASSLSVKEFFGDKLRNDREAKVSRGEYHNLSELRRCSAWFNCMQQLQDRIIASGIVGLEKVSENIAIYQGVFGREIQRLQSLELAAAGGVAAAV